MSDLALLSMCDYNRFHTLVKSIYGGITAEPLKRPNGDAGTDSAEWE